jgi:hypothetical protein
MNKDCDRLATASKDSLIKYGMQELRGEDALPLFLGI